MGQSFLWQHVSWRHLVLNAFMHLGSRYWMWSRWGRGCMFTQGEVDEGRIKGEVISLYHNGRMMLWYENGVEKPHWNNARSIAFGGTLEAGPLWNPNTGSGRGPPLLSHSRSICLSTSHHKYSIFTISKVFLTWLFTWEQIVFSCSLTLVTLSLWVQSWVAISCTCS